MGDSTLLALARRDPKAPRPPGPPKPNELQSTILQAGGLEAVVEVLKWATDERSKVRLLAF